MNTLKELAPMKRNGKVARPPAKKGARGRLGKKAQTVMQDIQELGGTAREMAHAKVEQWRASASAYGEEGRDKAQQAERSFEDVIRRKPLKSVLIAAGVGMLFGGIWMRR